MTADVMVGKFKDGGLPIFPGICALSRGFLKRKGGKHTIHFTAESSIAELLLRTIHSANQFSVCGSSSELV